MQIKPTMRYHNYPKKKKKKIATIGKDVEKLKLLRTEH